MTNNLTKDIYEKILEYDKIIINTHKNPDLDALGSQIGLYAALKSAFSSKSIYAVGDYGKYDRYKKYLSAVDAKEYSDALVITTDSGAQELIFDQNYSKGDFHIKIDHHVNTRPFGDICYVDESSISSCQIIYMLLESWGLNIDAKSAYALMEGLISDSGRFLYQSVNSETFYVASSLMKLEIDLPSIYSDMYKEEIDYKRYKGYVLSNFIITPNKVAYMKNYQKDVDSTSLSAFAIARGMVNCMANLEEVEVWANFTENDSKISAELRSKVISVNRVATSFGGGGHKLAAGATLENWSVVDEMIKALEDLVRQN